MYGAGDEDSPSCDEESGDEEYGEEAVLQPLTFLASDSGDEVGLYRVESGGGEVDD